MIDRERPWTTGDYIVAALYWITYGSLCAIPFVFMVLLFLYGVIAWLKVTGRAT